MTYQVVGADEIELGGLFVKESHRGNRLGVVIILLTLGFLINMEGKSLGRKEFIFCTHEKNEKIGELAKRYLCCREVGLVKISPPKCGKMDVNEHGLIEGKRYTLQNPDSFVAVAKWLKKWDEKLPDGTPVKLKTSRTLRRVSTSDIVSSLREFLTKQ
ncbi:hypothetical protein K3555_13665 [Leisingera sp. M527]|uniref:hypothetical protein n=1 Tax=Leisingera sp. M527 TaxID=2867014 RepID=UPI0021A35CAE|nr:hypothetical protein [Leisingera sp. M527]UWQ31640.1 hypothetical protein K3555_13665 [Leisingera sp. M527]